MTRAPPPCEADSALALPGAAWRAEAELECPLGLQAWSHSLLAQRLGGFWEPLRAAPAWRAHACRHGLKATLPPQPDQEIPGSPNWDPDSRFPADRETARFPIPDSRPIGNFKFESIGNREIPPKTGKTGDPIPDSRVTSEHQLQ